MEFKSRQLTVVLTPEGSETLDAVSAMYPGKSTDEVIHAALVISKWINDVRAVGGRVMAQNGSQMFELVDR